MTGTTIEIGLLWHSLRSGNHGVNALTVSNMALARAAAEGLGLTPRFTLFAPGDPLAGAAAGDDIAVMAINRRNLIGSRVYWDALGRLDYMLDISAGDSFADIYSARRFFWMWLTKRLTIARGVPLVLSPQTIGPFTRQPYARMAGAIMRRAELTVARDPLSYEAIGELAPAAKRMLSADVAFRLPYTPRAKAADGRRHVGVNVSGLLWAQGEGRGNAYRLSFDYVALTRRLLDTLAARADAQVHLVTHAVDPLHPDDDDGAVADGLAADYPTAIRVPDFAGPSEAKSYISGLDLLVGARMHACIAAFSSGVAVVPIAYSRKFIGLFGGLLGYPHSLPPSGHGVIEACGFILDRIDRQAELAAAVEAGNRRVAPLLDGYVAALTTLFSGGGRRRRGAAGDRATPPSGR